MPETQYEDAKAGKTRNYEFSHRIKDSQGRAIMPVPILLVTEEGHTLEFTGNDLAKMFSLFIGGLNL